MRVEHERDAARAELTAGARHVVGELRGQLAVDVRPVDARLLEQRAALEHACDTAAAARALPRVGSEVLGAIGVGERATDVGLKLVEELRGSIEQVRHARMLPRCRQTSRGDGDARYHRREH